MTFFSTRPLVGIVYKRPDGFTFTEWYHQQAFVYPEPSAEEWVNDRKWWQDHVRPWYNNMMMCVVRAK